MIDVKVNLKDVAKYLSQAQVREVAEKAGVDLENRGAYYLERCFGHGDVTEKLERSLSDHYKMLVEDDKLPSDWSKRLDCNPNTSELCAGVYQWLGTNIGFSELQTAFRKGGFLLTREVLDEEK